VRRLRSEFFYLGPKKVVNLRLTFISSTSVSHEKSNSGWSKLANGLSWRVWGYGYSLKKRNKQVIEGSSQVTLFLQLRLTTFIHIPSYKEDLGEEIHFTDGNDSSPCQPTYLFLTTSPMSVSMEWPEQTRIKAIATRIKVIPTPSEPDRSVPYWVKPCRTKGSTKTESAAGRGGLSAPIESRIILLVVRVSSLFLRPEEEATYTACVDRVSPSYSLSSLSLPRSLRQAFHNRKRLSAFTLNECSNGWFKKVFPYPAIDSIRASYASSSRTVTA
jgi:hypothetical protein